MLHHGRIALDFGLFVAPIHPSAWKVNSANFALTKFSEVPQSANSVLKCTYCSGALAFT
jgi:hypothetical protein